MRKQEIGNAVYLGFIDLEKAYYRVNMEALWQVLRMYDIGLELEVFETQGWYDCSVQDDSWYWQGKYREVFV